MLAFENKTETYKYTSNTLFVMNLVRIILELWVVYTLDTRLVLYCQLSYEVPLNYLARLFSLW